MAVFTERLDAALAQRKQQDLYRQRLTLQSAQGPLVRMQGREYLNFCSNDYRALPPILGL